MTIKTQQRRAWTVAGRLQCLNCAFVTLAGFALGACISEPRDVGSDPHLSDPPYRRVTVLVSTVRASGEGAPQSFNSVLSPTLRFMKHLISIPPTHKADVVEWPSIPPDPGREFVTLTSERLSEKEFSEAISGVHDSSVRLFVHGYNNTYQETVLRLAQITADSRDSRTAVLFAWPSQGSALSYNADQEAAAGSGPGLAKTIEILVRKRQGRVALLAHSMGGWLAMETLAEMSRKESRKAVSGLESVVLAAPDIDTTDMIRQLEAIGRLERPMTLLVSKDDGALAVSGFVTGGRRVGADDVHDPWVQSAAKQYGARVVDISELTASDGFRHSRFTAMVALYSRFHTQIDDPTAAHYAGPGTFVFRAATATLEPITR